MILYYYYDYCYGFLKKTKKKNTKWLRLLTYSKNGNEIIP